MVASGYLARTASLTLAAVSSETWSSWSPCHQPRQPWPESGSGAGVSVDDAAAGTASAEEPPPPDAALALSVPARIAPARSPVPTSAPEAIHPRRRLGGGSSCHSSHSVCCSDWSIAGLPRIPLRTRMARKPGHSPDGMACRRPFHSQLLSGREPRPPVPWPSAELSPDRVNLAVCRHSSSTRTRRETVSSPHSRCPAWWTAIGAPAPAAPHDVAASGDQAGGVEMPESVQVQARRPRSLGGGLPPGVG